MGRVAKYKKVKAFDRQHSGGEYVWGSADLRPSKKKRSKTAEKLKQKKLKRKRNNHNGGFFGGGDGGFDLPPQEKDEFSLSDLRVKKEKKPRLDDGLTPLSSTRIPKRSIQDSSEDAVPVAAVSHDKVKIGNRTINCTIPQNDKEERRITKILNIDRKSGETLVSKSSKASSKIQGRQEGESIRAFNKRLKQQARVALTDDYKNKASKPKDKYDIVVEGEDTMSKKDRRKEFMKKKKMKKKKGMTMQKSAYDNIQNDEGDGDDYLDAEDSIAPQIPSFLEQAEAPPTFSRLPRGAEKKSNMKVREKSGDKNIMMDEQSRRAEQNAMEAMRRKVQAQYALI
eukprot:CAMPEP_0203706902 /NCGR_PEP_ID=MMETSP0091-20130426/54513_1 /ASSEMBLY_ACC=CAM_ASM_001089 /TAXON_ID=426623 /ORGANISM="Chaetoceros affinis, Strain CCMP159" /LENGTH=339 /DNA_ID=CAMNT_0050582897 /DNA_START=44 /DNA_END=1060 /DNA_ORIENTATION=+